MRTLLPALLLSVLSTAGAAPYRPAADAEVLERLPAATPDRRALQNLRARLAANPADRVATLDLARRYIALGRTDADPRYFGHAEALLLPWLPAETPDPEALLLRAVLLQNRHAFAPALADLDRALDLQPRSPGAWLLRASILEVQGDYPAALAGCMAAAGLRVGLAEAVCLDSALSLAGQADYAYRRLQEALAQTRARPEDRQWALVTLGEMAERLGRYEDAERHYREALGLDVRSAYLLMVYADFLLDRDRAREIPPLLGNKTRADPLLLRLTLAEQRLDDPDLPEHIAALEARFAASRARNDTTHRGDEARFTLHLLHQPEAALRLAEANWAVQREPRDARILLEAAQAAGRPSMADPVLDFLARNRLEDVRLARWTRRLAEQAR